MVGEEARDHTPDIGGHEAFLIENRVFSGLQRGDNSSVGGRATDAVFLQRLDQAGFGEARRGLGEVLLAIQFIDRQHIPFGQRRQLAAVFFGRVVHVFHVHADEAGEHQHLAIGAEQRGITAQTDIHTHRIETRRRHLARKCALPDHFVKTCLISVQITAHLVRRALD